MECFCREELGSVSCLAGLIASFRETYAQVRYELYSGNVDNIKDRMERGLLDIGLFSVPAKSLQSWLKSWRL